MSAELRRLAEGATPGERTFIPSTSYRVGGRTRAVGPMVTAANDIAHGGGSMQFRGSTTTEDADAAYIAAVNPQAVLALLDVVDAARDYSPRYDHDWRCEIRTAEAGWKSGDPPVIRCECGYDELRAALERLDR